MTPAPFHGCVTGSRTFAGLDCLTVRVKATSPEYELASAFSLRCNLSIEEIAYQRDDLIGLVFQGEVAGVDQMKLGVG